MPRARIYASAAERAKAWRERRRAELAGEVPPRRPPCADAVALAKWTRQRLRVPAGHPLAGRPFALPDWQLAVVDDVLTHGETCLCVSRKNGKSGLVAAIVLGHLVGPLRRPGWRYGILSWNRTKAGELLQQIEKIAKASDFKLAQGRPEIGAHLRVQRTPWPGRIIADDLDAVVDIEGAGHASGHASGFDLSIIDELGLLQERHRPAVAGMRSAVSAKGGRFLSLSIHGSGPFVGEILSRKGAPGLAIHHYHGDPDATLDDPKNWRAANPGLGSIKTVEYMRGEARRVLDTPSDQKLFEAADLNLPGELARERVTSFAAWRQCTVAAGELPARSGRCFVGIDLGGNRSFTSAAMYWPSTGRLEVLTACPDVPSLAARARADAAGGVYERAHRDGSLMVLSGRLTPVGPFLARLRAHLAGAPVGAVGCDHERAQELLHHLEDQGLGWRPVWRGSGTRAAEDGANDIRGFQRAVEGGKLRTPANGLMLYALRHSFLLRDADGNPVKVRQVRQRARIDSLQAALIAVGLGESALLRRRKRSLHVASTGD